MRTEFRKHLPFYFCVQTLHFRYDFINVVIAIYQIDRISTKSFASYVLDLSNLHYDAKCFTILPYLIYDLSIMGI